MGHQVTALCCRNGSDGGYWNSVSTSHSKRSEKKLSNGW